MAYGSSTAGSKKVSSKQASMVAERFGLKKAAPVVAKDAPNPIPTAGGAAAEEDE